MSRPKSKIPQLKKPAPLVAVASSPPKSLYERLGGKFGIAKVVDVFSDTVLADPLVGVGSPNQYLREWSERESGQRLAGLKSMRTEWLCQVAGGPQRYEPTHLGPTGTLDLQNAHCRFHITPEEFDRVAKILQETMQSLGVGKREQKEVLAAFGAHKAEVTFGQTAQQCPFSRIRL